MALRDYQTDEWDPKAWQWYCGGLNDSRVIPGGGGWAGLVEWARRWSLEVVADPHKTPGVAALLAVTTDGRRRSTSVTHVTALALDCDRGLDPRPVIEVLKKAGLCFLFYETKRSCPATPRWRIIMPLAQPCPSQDLPPLWTFVARLVAAEAGLPDGRASFDAAGCQANHMWLAPLRATVEDPPRQVLTLDGAALDTQRLLADAPALRAPAPITRLVTTGPAEVDTEALIETLAANWPPEGSRHDTTLAVAHVLGNAGLEVEVIGDVIFEAARQAGDREARDRKTAAISALTSAATRTRGWGWLRSNAPDLGEALRQLLPASSEVMDMEPIIRAVEVAEDTPSWPTLAPEALYGVAGKFVRRVEPHTEADPAALLVGFLVAAGNMLGRGPYYLVEKTRHHTNLFAVFIGETSRGRKGTAWNRILDLLRRVDPSWAKDCIKGGLASGEGLIWHVRDAIVTPSGKTEDPGVQDKRLLVEAAEFSQPLKIAARKGNTLSDVLRQAWDSGELKITSKNSPAKATDAHVSMVGHITIEELRRHLTKTEVANGFGNRFLWLLVKRSKCLPFGGHEPELDDLVEDLRETRQWATQERRITWDAEAARAWEAVYPSLTESEPGLVGELTARQEAQAVRLATLYAVLDRSDVIRLAHLRAALAIVEYVADTVRLIWGDLLGDPTADAIMEALRSAPDGLTRTQLRDLFSRNRSAADIDRALSHLLKQGKVQLERRESGGRPAVVVRPRNAEVV